MARQVGHCIRDERLQVEVCLEKKGKNENGKEIGKNAFLSFPVPPNFDTLFPMLAKIMKYR